MVKTIHTVQEPNGVYVDEITPERKNDTEAGLAGQFRAINTNGHAEPETEPARFGEFGGQYLVKERRLESYCSHKINNAVGQILLARRLGKTKIIAETGAGQHGVATATVCAKFNMECFPSIITDVPW